MTLATTFLAAALVVPNMPPPEYDDSEVVESQDAGYSRRDIEFVIRCFCNTCHQMAECHYIHVNGDGVHCELKALN